MYHFIALLLTFLHVIIAIIVGGIGSVLFMFRTKNFRDLTAMILVIGGIYMLIGAIFFPVFAIGSFALFWPVYIVTLYLLHIKKEDNTLT
jgi:energy-converting hydrogenase Eha subunit C